MEILEAPDARDEPELRGADFLMIGPGHEDLQKAASSQLPVVKLVTEETFATNGEDDELPLAAPTHPRELRLALRAAALEFRARRLLSDIAGPWAHDARGSLGVAQLALKLLEPNAETPSPVQRAENGISRLGYLMERLPSQIALALDLPLVENSAPSLFPSLDSYVNHLRRIHPRRSIELVNDHQATLPTGRLVLFAAGFVEFAIKLSDARAGLRITVGSGATLEVECECPNRPPPWDVQGSLNLERPDGALPYRLVDAVRLAARLGAALSVALTSRSYIARVNLGPG